MAVRYLRRGPLEAVCRTSPSTYNGPKHIEFGAKQGLPKGRPRSDFSLDRPSAHLTVHVVRLADRQRNDRQGRIASPGARELTAITDEQILDVVGLTPPVANPVGGHSTHPQRAHVVAVGKWRTPYDVLRVPGLEN